MRNKAFGIGAVFFGLPVLLFVASYIYDIQTNKSNDLLIPDTGSKIVVSHTIAGSKKLAISGFIKNRVDENRIEIANLQITDQFTGEKLCSFNYAPFYKQVVTLGSNDVQITEVLKLPTGIADAWQDHDLFHHKLNFDKDRGYILNKKRVTHIESGGSSQRSNFFDKVEKLKGTGLKNIKLKRRQTELFLLIGKLAAHSINGDKRSLEILSNFECYFGVKLGEDIKKFLYCTQSACCE